MKSLNIKQIAWVSLLMLLFLLAPRTATGMELQVSFNEVAQTADLIFTGTVVDQSCRLNDQRTMIFTDVLFDAVEIFESSDGSVQRDNTMITVSFAGGQLEEFGVRVSDVPQLETGQRYMIFTRDDGRPYANPIIGGAQGLFRLIEDLETGDTFVLTAGDRAVTGFDGGEMTVGSDRVLAIQGTSPITEKHERQLAPAPETAGSGSAWISDLGRSGDQSPLRLADFIRHIREQALVTPRGRRQLRVGDSGTRLEPGVASEELPRLLASNGGASSFFQAFVLPEPVDSGKDGRSTDMTGGYLGYCGWQYPVIMEQVPTSWWNWEIIESAVFDWGCGWDVLETTPGDGYYGWYNGENEFPGWLDDAALHSMYGVYWNGALANTIYWWYQECGEIQESDVIFNAAYNWTNDPEYAYGNEDVVLFKPVCMHALGHTWGYMNGPFIETHDYDKPTVMHAYHYNLIENGTGIHVVDVELIFLNYYVSGMVYAPRDAGVESYWASEGLHNSDTDSSSYSPGSNITLYNVTVENMTKTSLEDVRLRFFLSPDTEITESDYQLGSGTYWYWTSFTQTAYNVSDYQSTIPSSIPAGQYYVGAIVTPLGFSMDADEYQGNNITRFFDRITITGPPPPPPTNVQATDGEFCAAVYLSWSHSSGATEYRVYRDGTPIGSWMSGTWYEDYGVTPGAAYDYSVKARNSNGTSGFSDSDTGFSDGTVPPSPNGLSATDGTYADRVRVTWNATDNTDYYVVYRNGEFFADAVFGTSYNDYSAAPGVVYSYHVKAGNACGFSGSSNSDNGHRSGGSGSNVFLVTGAGPAVSNSPTVRVFPAEQSASHIEQFNAYGAPQYGVNVSCGDVTGDGLDEILTGPGPGEIYGPQVRGFNISGNQLSGLNFMAYGTLKYGTNVAAGDIDGDGTEEIITGPGPGAVFGPHVRAFDANFNGTSCNVTPTSGVSFFSYGTLKWGVNVAAGDIDGDGMDEIVTGPGPGAVFGPHIRGWNVDGGQAQPISGVSYFAYGTPRYGAVVTCGDIDGDGIDEIVTAPGPSSQFAAHIRGWNYDGSSLAPIDDINFFAWPESQVRHGARIFSGRDLDGNGRDELIVSAGPDPSVQSPVKVYEYSGSLMGPGSELFSLQAYPAGWTHGANVAAGRF